MARILQTTRLAGHSAGRRRDADMARGGGRGISSHSSEEGVCRSAGGPRAVLARTPSPRSSAPPGPAGCCVSPAGSLPAAAAEALVAVVAPSRAVRTGAAEASLELPPRTPGVAAAAHSGDVSSDGRGCAGTAGAARWRAAAGRPRLLYGPAPTAGRAGAAASPPTGRSAPELEGAPAAGTCPGRSPKSKSIAGTARSDASADDVSCTAPRRRRKSQSQGSGVSFIPEGTRMSVSTPSSECQAYNTFSQASTAKPTLPANNRNSGSR